ncbi:hypothetical protein FYK55_26880 [Roseiconus nitratireducens]|uniref:Uncharacterized protein n=1 Tax=Roseiconus nitratireducens TaxID=2605748 RepID=A0A5M6CZ98_9BACT|nr:hypothetical protein [Roseiconus nitratireducens]KAA5538639.1 hypothetical protein FYK55_26880 [Roseiconus nitratireducens]
MRLAKQLLLLFSCCVLAASPAPAGMPGALPEDIDTLLRLSGPAEARLRSISFFVAGICAASVAVKLLWNVIAKDSGWLPHLSWSKAVAVVLLWGALFVLVLTMVSGARELLTPGAWKKDGITYTLENEQ